MSLGFNQIQFFGPYGLLHYGHVLKCGPKSWRTKTAAAS
jgi:hypothetical protein